MIDIYLKARNGNYDAKGKYNEGEIIVIKGSKIQMDFAEHIRGGKTAKKYREDANFVNTDGIVLKDCVFSSSSTAAQFVTGRSTNGKLAWHLDKKTTLKKYLENK